MIRRGVQQSIRDEEGLAVGSRIVVSQMMYHTCVNLTTGGAVVCEPREAVDGFGHGLRGNGRSDSDIASERVRVRVWRRGGK